MAERHLGNQPELELSRYRYFLLLDILKVVERVLGVKIFDENGRPHFDMDRLDGEPNWDAY
jgi:hypothetical protein